MKTPIRWVAGLALVAVGGGLALLVRSPASSSVMATPSRHEDPTPSAPSIERAENFPHSRRAVEALDIELVRGGVPVQNAAVILLDPSGGRRLRRSDASGRAQFEPVESTGILLVGRTNAFPYRQAISLGAGAHRIELPTEQVVSGNLRLAGSPPSLPIDVTLSTPWSAFEDLGLDPATRRELSLDEEHHFVSSCATDAEGAFAFEGLPEGWCGSLEFPEGYCPIPWDARETAGWVELAHPESDLALELQRLPFVRGRLVASDGKTPIARAVLSVGLPADELTSWSSSATNEQGVFEIALRDGAITRVAIHADCGATGWFLREWPISEAIRDRLDLGDLTLVRGTELAFRTTDEEGRPVSGAMGSLSYRDLPARTGADGVGTLQGILRTPGEFFVKASGFWRVRVPIPEHPATQVEVPLRHCNRLSIDLKGENGRLPTGLSVLVGSGERELFPELEWPAPPYWGADELGATSFRLDFEGNQTAFEVNADGRATLEGVNPEIPLKMRVLAPFDVPIHECEIAALGGEERRVMTVTVPTSCFSVSGTVRDSEGHLLPGAIVRISGGTSHEGGDVMDQLDRRTDEAGRFRFDSLYFRTIDIAVERPGYVRVPVTEVELSKDLTLDYRLSRGYGLVVRVVDVLGRSLEGTEGPGIVSAENDSDRWQAERSDSGLFQFKDLPAGTLEIELALAGVRYPIEHDPQVPELVFTVPVHGQLEVFWPPPEVSEEVRRQYRGRQGSGDLLLHKEGEERIHDSAGVQLSDGQYTFPAVLPGRYRVELDSGFDVAFSDAFEVAADQLTRVTIAKDTIRPKTKRR